MSLSVRRAASFIAPLTLALSALAAPVHAAAHPDGEAAHQGAEAASRSNSCQAIDSLSSSRNEGYTAAIIHGRAFAGEWDEKNHTIVWQDLSDNDGYRFHACDITISKAGKNVWIKALTTDGQVYETSCHTSGQGLKCHDRWTEIPAPGHPDAAMEH